MGEGHHQPLVPGQAVPLVAPQTMDQAQARVLAGAQAACHEPGQEIGAVLQEGFHERFWPGRQGQIVLHLFGIEGAQGQPLGEGPEVILGEGQGRRRDGLHQPVQGLPVRGAGEADAPGGPPGRVAGFQLGQQGAAQDQGLEQAQGRSPEGDAAAQARVVRGQAGQPGQGPLPTQGHRVGFHQGAVGQEDPGPGGGQPIPAVEVPRQPPQGAEPGVGIRLPRKADDEAAVQRAILEDRTDHASRCPRRAVCGWDLQAIMRATT